MKISAFDLDKTLLSINCSYHFGAYICRFKPAAYWRFFTLLVSYALMTVGVISIKQINRLAFKLLFKGKNEKDIRKWANDFFVEYASKKYNQAVLQRLVEAQSNGEMIVLLSSSPKFLVEIFAQHLKIDKVLATSYIVDREGTYLEIENVILGVDKAHYLRGLCEISGVQPKYLTAYSDSIHDLPMLDLAGHPICVNPDRQLRKLSLRKHWAVL